jgi:hypothetical protein
MDPDYIGLWLLIDSIYKVSHSWDYMTVKQFVILCVSKIIKYVGTVFLQLLILLL